MNPYEEMLKKIEGIGECFVNPPRHCGKSSALAAMSFDLSKIGSEPELETGITLDRAMYSVAEELGLDIRVDKCEGYPDREYKYISRLRGFAIKIMVPKYALNVRVRETRWIQVVSSFIRRNHAAYCMCADNRIFNNPATIVFWLDGTKTVVKAENEEFDPEKGLAMAICKKTLGNKGSYYNEIKKWIK